MAFEQEFAKGNTATSFYHVAKYWYDLGQNSAKPEYYMAIDDALVCRDMTTTGNAKVDLNNLICMELKVALDPTVSFNAANDPFLFGLKRGQEEAAKEIVTLLESMFWFQSPKENEPVIYRNQAIEAIKEKFDLEA